MSKKRYVVGYGYRLSSEPLKEASGQYLKWENLNGSKQDAVTEFVMAKLNSDISKSSKPKVFRVVVEDCE